MFHKKYQRDKLVPLAADQRTMLPLLSGCIACGRCNSGWAFDQGSSRELRTDLMQFIVSASRSMPDFDAAKVTLDRFGPLPAQALRRRCPASIPFHKLASFINTAAVIPGALPHAGQHSSQADLPTT